jgi:hypothetical protein
MILPHIHNSLIPRQSKSPIGRRHVWMKEELTKLKLQIEMTN